MDLRRGIDYIGVTCAFWCHDGNGRILMHKRGEQCRDEQGRWDCGGGSMEFGETFEECIQRELMEEYGTEPLEMKRFLVDNVLREHNGKQTHWIKIVYWVLVDPSKVTNAEPDKHECLGWFTFDTLPSPLHSQVEVEVETLKNFLLGNAAL
ncbi:NUDIX domain-containing protein [Candidatus Uhrbacteria bacterium]|nr:NUDIX domain-containing protein [Candidatus Uhrbacteria bacterium]